MPITPASQLTSETLTIPSGHYSVSPHLGETVYVPEFKLDRFPISVAHYQRFINEGGYEDYDYWDDDGWHWLQTERIESPRFWNGHNPDLDGMFTTVQGKLLAEFAEPNKPVIGVSWYEADAFCRFFGRQLPSETQWEAAARGAHNNLYPWGNSWMPTGIGAWGNRSGGKRVTACLGKFPEAKGPFGHEDLVGNIWQWTKTPWESQQKPDSDAVLMTAKGGGWGSNKSQCTNAARNGFYKTDQWTHVGFRTIAP